ncbi:MAG TPA: cellulase family glycosylhydrolase [Candidatus Synoicihabitans sp.]|nr:cellulase family glycosylhydrolase [Candidatus Synoicihabitans sp.]
MKIRMTVFAAAIACFLMLPAAAYAQLRSPTYGWNLGNTMEAPGGEGTWAPPATQALINAVANSGFNTVRIPVAWNSHANQSTYQIDAAWLARVKQVVDWCYARNLTVIINNHWDNGWLDNALDGNVDASVNARMQSYWAQIANTFAAYDSRLLFAGANEPPADNAAKMSELMTYYQTFVNAVRATGGNNRTRWLVLPGPSTNIDQTYDLMNTLPNDPTPGRLIVEVHDYSPYQYTLMTADESWGKMFYFWGQGYRHPTRTDRNPTWGEESYIQAQYQKMKTKFVDQGVPVLLGEFGTGLRSGYSDLTGADYNRHVASRTYWNKTLLDTANSMGLRPVYWDNGYAGSNGFALYDRNTAAVLDQASITSLTGGAAIPPPGGGGGIVANGTYRIMARHSGKALEVASAGTANGSNVRQWAYNGGNHQRWTLTHLGNNQYSIVGVQSGKALDVSGWGGSNGTNVHIWTYGGGANQKWTLTATRGGYYRLTPTHATNMALDVNGVSSADGANAQIWTYGGGNNQQWTFQVP